MENSNDTIQVLFGLKISQLVDVVSIVLGLVTYLLLQTVVHPPERAGRMLLAVAY